MVETYYKVLGEKPGIYLEGRRNMKVELEGSSLFNALDLPPEAHDLQNLYWDMEREWRRKKKAFETVLEEILKSVGRESIDDPRNVEHD